MKQFKVIVNGMELKVYEGQNVVVAEDGTILLGDIPYAAYNEELNKE